MHSGSADQKVKTWDVRLGACVATAKLDGAVSCLTVVDDGPVPVLGLTDAGTLHCLDPRTSRAVVQSLKPGARTGRCPYCGCFPSFGILARQFVPVPSAYTCPARDIQHISPE